MIGAALSAGGSAGAWSLGAFCNLIDHGVHIEAVAGNSMGAMQGAAYCMFPMDQNDKASRFMQDQFLPLKSRDIWRHRFPLRRLHGLWLSSFVDARPLHKRVREILDDELIVASGKLLRVGAVNQQTREYRVFTELDEDIVDAVLASAAFPAAFQPIEIKEQKYVDGGVVSVTPIKSLIDCGCTEIYVIVCHPKDMQATRDDSVTGLEEALRAVDSMSHQVMSKDIEIALLHNRIAELDPKSPKRPIKFHIIRPMDVQTREPLRFDPAESMRMFDRGYATVDRMRVVEEGKAAAKRLSQP